SGTFFPMVRVTEHVQGAGAVLQGVTIDGGWGVATESGDWALARVVNGLENNGKLDLADVVFQNLSASAAYTDNLDAIAAIYNNGTLHAWNVEVNDSEAEGGMNGGGGYIVFNDGELHVVDFLLSGNKAMGGDGFDDPLGGSVYQSGNAVIFYNDGELRGTPTDVEESNLSQRG